MPEDVRSGGLLPHQDRTVLSDDFLGWLRFVNAGMLDDGNVIAMDYAIARMPAGAVVEIGSFCGLSSNVIAHLRRRHGRTDPFFACDPWMFEGADTPDTPMGDGGISFGEYRELVKTSCERNLRAFSRHDLPHTLESLSDGFFEEWGSGAERVDIFGRTAKLGGPIGFAYIDGDHRYYQARRDFENADAHLANGGFILFDDSADGSGWEVCRVMQEILADRPDYELVDRFPNYMFRKSTQ
jgi:hypothetical protein